MSGFLLASSYDFLRIRLRLRDQFARLSVGFGGNFLGLLIALGQVLRRNGLAVRDHPFVHALLVGLRQIRALDTYIDDLDTVVIALHQLRNFLRNLIVQVTTLGVLANDIAVVDLR
ncbi:hypothetical protein D3C84_1095600 [compost metagenome]